MNRCMRNILAKEAVIIVHVGCHVQGFKHGFSLFINFEYGDSTIINIDCTEPANIQEIFPLFGDYY